MRILHVGKYFPPVHGGMERFLGDLAQAQRAAGHDVNVLVHDDGRSDLRADPPWVMRCPVWIRLFFAPISPLFPLWLRRAIARHDPDVIHLHMPNLSAFWVLLLPSARRRTWIVHWHSDVERSRRSLRILYPHYSIFERALLDRAEIIVVTSPQYLEASQPLSAWRSKCRVVPLGVDPMRLPAVTDSETQGLWKTDGLRLLAVGRLTYYKGFETLVRAVVGDPGKQLVIIGAGEERPRLERLLQPAGDPASVALLGEAGDATLVRLMASCDVFCLPSIERTEAFGIVLVEAMRYGKPLLVSDIQGSGVGYVARHGQNAIAVPAGDEKAWRAAIDDLAAHPDRRRLMGLLGSQRYEREFGIASVAAKLDLIYSLALRVDAQSGESEGAAEPLRHAASGANLATNCSERLLVVIPALNEAECIGEVIAQAKRYPGVDVLVVDDGSTDETAAVALLHGARVLRAPLWQGAWGAIQTGMRYAARSGYRAVITMDADGQHEPAYLPMLIDAATGADVVIAACPSRGSRLRHLAWSYFRMLTGLSFDDLTSGFRYYNGSAYRILAGEEATLLDYQDIGVLLLLRVANLRIAEVAVAMNPRRSGASRVFSSWWTVARYMAETSLLCLSHWKPKTVAAPRCPDRRIPMP